MMMMMIMGVLVVAENGRRGLMLLQRYSVFYLVCRLWEIVVRGDEFDISTVHKL